MLPPMPIAVANEKSYQFNPGSREKAKIVLGNGRRAWCLAGREGGVETRVDGGSGFGVETDHLAADKIHDHTAIVFQLEMSNVLRVDHILTGSYIHRFN